MKKGDLSINIIIVAAIALIILVIISVLVFGTGRRINIGTSCEGIGGQCADGGPSGYTTCAEWAQYRGDPGVRYIKHPTAPCQSEEQFCCVPQ